MWALLGLAMVAAQRHDFPRAGALAGEALTWCRALREVHGCAWALLVLARSAPAAGNLALAEQRHSAR